MRPRWPAAGKGWPGGCAGLPHGGCGLAGKGYGAGQYGAGFAPPGVVGYRAPRVQQSGQMYVGKGRPAHSGGPAQPLSDAAVQSITSHLQNCIGGAESLGRIVARFPGVKKAQLASCFSIVPRENVDDPLVSLDPSFQPGGEGMAGEWQKKKKQKKPHDPNAPAPPPLTDDQVHSVAAVLEAAGGTLTLGKLTTRFEGVKKAQLEGHFAIYPDQGTNGECAVGLHHMPGPVVAMHVAPPQPAAAWQPGAWAGAQTQGALNAERAKKKKKKSKSDPNAPPPPELDPETVQNISLQLQADGGTMRLGRVTTLFMGVKKVQLEPHFNIYPLEGTEGEFAVGMPGLEPPGAQQFGLATFGDASEAPKGKKQKKPRDPDAPPPPPLEDAAVEELRSYLTELGGAISLGKLTTRFEGVKKAQVEAHFHVVRTGDGEFMVFLDSDSAAQAELVAGGLGQL